jgi:hypothetical protein
MEVVGKLRLDTVTGFRDAMPMFVDTVPIDQPPRDFGMPIDG